MFRRARYQRGSLQRVKRKSGPAVWIFRWYEVQAGGRKTYRKRVVGTVEDLKTETDARKALDVFPTGEHLLQTYPRRRLTASADLEFSTDSFRLSKYSTTYSKSPSLTRIANLIADISRTSKQMLRPFRRARNLRALSGHLWSNVAVHFQPMYRRLRSLSSTEAPRRLRMRGL